ncbi:PHP-associated domain-containing protein [Vibrio mediterranei]|uniref:PHP-associated domain-containing protein n=1 Tax=Vibrio mediterranei TaxID=689 RepID=UPI0038CE0E0C
MHIDTHVHLLINKKQKKPDFIAINSMLDIAKASSITTICVTEHIESAGYDSLMREIFIENKLDGKLFSDHVLTKQGIKLYPGAELQLENGTNIGVHTSLDILMNLNHEEGAYTLTELDKELASYKKWYSLVAHHIFWKNKTYPNHDELAHYVNAIEVPAKDLDNVEQYIELADKYNLPTTGGSDAHTFIQIGACYTELDNFPSCEEHPLNYATKSNYHNHRFSDFSKRLVEMSNIFRTMNINQE